MRGSRHVLLVCLIVALLSFHQSFSQAVAIHYDSGFSWRGYNGTELPLCATKLCHRFPMVEWDSYYTESTIWKGTNDNPNEASAFLNFRIVFPAGYDINDRTKSYPVIIMLHGAGESGRVWQDNFIYTSDDSRYDNNSNSLLNGGNEHRLAAAKAAGAAGAFPGIVVFPQASYSAAWDDHLSAKLTQNEEFIVRLIEDYLVPRYHADINRITMHGLSAGATGTWGFAQKRPDLFASILVMSGVPFDLNGAKSKLVTTPIRIFQGGLDTNPRPATAQTVVDALTAEGGKPELYLYEDLEHNTWERAYAEPDFFSWILASNKKNIYVFDNKTEVCPGVDSVKMGFSANMQTYQWINGENELLRGTDRFFYAKNPGTYKVRFKRPNGDIDLSFELQLKLKAGCQASVEEPTVPVTAVRDEFPGGSSNDLFPNPATDRVYIAGIQNEELGMIHVVSSSGQMIRVPVSSEEGNAELNISSLTPGVYVVRTSMRSFKLLKR